VQWGSDPGLLEAFRRGEHSVLEQVYRAYAPSVARYLERSRAGRSGVLDVAAAQQESFARAFSPRAREAYDGRRPYAAWLRAVARSAAVAVLRRGGRLAERCVPLEQVEEGAGWEAEGESPEEHVLREEGRTLVRRFLAGLGAQERSLLELRFMEGLSQREAGEELGLSRQEVRTREARLRQELGRYLSAAGW
jgi:RNA polymerase sigma-70 factor, ECF subfamily